MHTRPRAPRILRPRSDPVPRSISMPHPVRSPQPTIHTSLQRGLRAPHRSRCWAAALDPSQLANRDTHVHCIAVCRAAGADAGDLVPGIAELSWRVDVGGAGVGVGLEGDLAAIGLVAGEPIAEWARRATSLDAGILRERTVIAGVFGGIVGRALSIEDLCVNKVLEVCQSSLGCH